MIAGIGKVMVDVEDQDRAVRFWTQVLGFELVIDAPYDQGRWIEVATPDGRTHLVLSLRESAVPDVPAGRPTSNVFFRTDDLPATFTALRERGVEFPQEPVEYPWGWWSIFADSEGNRFALEPTGT